MPRPANAYKLKMTQNHQKQPSDEKAQETKHPDRPK